MATVDLTNPELTAQDREDIRSEVERFEVLYQDRYGALSDAGVQLANEIEANAQEETEIDSRLETLYEQVRDMRDGYCDGDMPGAIEKLYNQVSEMTEGND